MRSQVAALRKFFPVDKWPALPCPRCDATLTALKGDIHYDRLSTTMARWSELGYEPDDIRGVFSGRLVCVNLLCGEVVSVLGDFAVGWDEGPTGRTELGEFLKVRMLHPALSLVETPSGVPEPVVTELDRAAAIIWSDPRSAITALRTGLERLMDAQGVPAQAASGGPPLGLHKRLKDFRTGAASGTTDAATRANASDLLEAVKWVGNDGTHAGGATIDAAAVLEMAEFIEIALRMLYAPNNAAALARAKRIITSKALVD
ncbi:DUF4145 domain-containing protein [Williamsia soli]|uniref:DUF4145 domain-containing protein n=1 Tax=Williamsia soli TaxID=364929 RepID=UPI001A9CDB25|nr:DUF4145 domain-containing protein [Williamsia soli]